MKRTFEMNGKTYGTLTAIAKDLGVKRVYTRDFAKYGITEITSVNNTTILVSRSVNILDDVQDTPADDTQDAVPATDSEDTPADVIDLGDTVVVLNNSADTFQEDDSQDTSAEETTDEVTAEETAEETVEVQEVQEVSADDSVETPAEETTDETEESQENPLETGGSQIIFAQVTSAGLSISKVIDIPNENSQEETKADQPQEAPKAEVKPQKPLTEEELIAKIEQDVVDYADADELGQNIRKISVDGLAKMVQNVQGDDWARITNPGIRKMRLIMELKKAYFPQSQPKSLQTKTYSSSPWKKITTDALKAAAVAANQTWKDCDNEGILRMRLIMVLKKADIKPEDIQK